MKPTLLIMAAGMGSRYGGLKQIDPVGPNGEIIIDYSMRDAVAAGFGKVVFVIRQYFEDAFREKIGSKLDGLVETAYVYQELESCMDGRSVPPDREKPWGTGHAILVGRDQIQEPFAVINADDFYGPRSIQIIADYLADESRPDNEYAMVGFILRNTLSEHGHVCRGVCSTDPQDYLQSVVERVKIHKDPPGAVYPGPDGAEARLSGDEIVSMNLWGFRPSVFDHLQRLFEVFVEENRANPKAEFYIPTVVDRLIAEDQVRVKVLTTPDSWFGVTYREDREIAMASIRQRIADGVYPERLWT